MILPPITEIIALIQQTPGCELLPPTGLPILSSSLQLPADVEAFYHVAGGASIFAGGGFLYPFFIVKPEAFVAANPLIIGEPNPDDRSSSWYTLVHDGNGDFLTIDLSSDRLGVCYDSFHETHGLSGQTPVVALSFSELVIRLINNNGNHPYWLQPDFAPLGDAYDNL